MPENIPRPSSFHVQTAFLGIYKGRLQLYRDAFGSKPRPIYCGPPCKSIFIARLLFPIFRLPEEYLHDNRSSVR